MDGKINIFLDFDSTIVDSIKRFVELANNKYGVEKDYKNLGTYGFSNLYPEITKNEIYNIFAMDEFYDSNIDWMPFAKNTLEKMRDYFDIHIVTTSSGKNLELKRMWALENMPYVKNIYHVNSNDKSVVDMSGGIQIDDVYECLKNTNASVKLLYKNYNNYKWQRHNDSNIYNVNCWNEISDMLYFYLQNGVI